MPTPQGLALELTSLCPVPPLLCPVLIPSAPVLIVSKGKRRALCCCPALYSLLLQCSWDPTESLSRTLTPGLSFPRGDVPSLLVAAFILQTRQRSCPGDPAPAWGDGRRQWQRACALDCALQGLLSPAWTCLYSSLPNSCQVKGGGRVESAYENSVD